METTPQAHSSGGGFFPATAGSYLPSPAPSNFSDTHSRNTNLLPQPRSQPLKPGSKRESAFINYVDAALLGVSRKYTKKFPSDEEKQNQNIGPDDVIGYSDVEQLVIDLERIVGLVWVSGTSNLQIAYLLSMATSLLQWLPPFPARPVPTFRLLNRLDLAFYTLIGEFRMNATEKVRLASIVKLTRAMMLMLMEGVELDHKEESDSEDDDDDDDESEGGLSPPPREYVIKEETEDTDEEMDDVSDTSARTGRGKSSKRRRRERRIEEEVEEDSWEMEVAKVYERVLGQIGGDVGDTPIGLVFD